MVDTSDFTMGEKPEDLNDEQLMRRVEHYTGESHRCAREGDVDAAEAFSSAAADFLREAKRRGLA